MNFTGYETLGTGYSKKIYFIKPLMSTKWIKKCFFCVISMRVVKKDFKHF